MIKLVPAPEHIFRIPFARIGTSAIGTKNEQSDLNFGVQL